MPKHHTNNTVENSWNSNNRVLNYTIQGRTYTTREYCLARGIADPKAIHRIWELMDAYARRHYGTRAIIGHLKRLVTKQLQTQERNNMTRNTQRPDDELTAVDFYIEESIEPEDFELLEQEEAMETLMRKYIRAIERRKPLRTAVQDAQLAYVNIEKEIAQMRCEMHKLLKPQVQHTKRKKTQS